MRDAATPVLRPELRTLIYKRTHQGDPNSRGHFGCDDCMGRVRSWRFDAVIGVGGVGALSSSNELNRKINWIGIGPRKRPRLSGRGPVVAFDHFVLFEERGPDLALFAPQLAKRLFSRNVRVLLHDISPDEKNEIRRILELAVKGRPSKPLTRRAIARYSRTGHSTGCSCGGCRRRRTVQTRHSAC
jgi:hypothetical protein